ncbi:MAG: VirB4 family type IV secretion system protein, partial [Halocynthiibacter sp.]
MPIFRNALLVRITPLTISDGTLLGFFSAINSGVLEPISRGSMSLIAEDVANISPRFLDGIIKINDGLNGTRYAAVLVVKNYPHATQPGMLDVLDAGNNMIICHSFTPIHRDTISERAVRRAAQMQASADVAETVKNDLLLAADAIQSGTLGFGEHQFSITVFAETKTELEAAIGRISGAASQARFKMIRDRTTLEASYFATHPGNMDYRCHDVVASSLNMADAASFHSCSTGLAGAHLPWRAPITVFPTIIGSAHRFSFHARGDPEKEPTNGHTLVLGPSGSGKTLLMGFLASQARHLGARVFMFDKDSGLKLTTLAMGGQFAEIRTGQPTGLSPLASETDQRGQDWLLRWLISLLESTGAPLTPQQSDKLQGAIRQNAAAPIELRNFAAFQDLIGDVGDRRDLAHRLAEWAPGGRCGWVFAPAEHALVNYADNPVVTVDLSEILSAGTERTAVLAYLFRRIERLMEDRLPTIIVIDEAWQVLDDSYFRKTLEAWLVSARKKNTVVVMMTQFPSQVKSSNAASILEALPNQLIFPNRKARTEDYDDLGLNDAELSFVL